jgi:hypothetical protein
VISPVARNSISRSEKLKLKDGFRERVNCCGAEYPDEEEHQQSRKLEGGPSPTDWFEN